MCKVPCGILIKPRGLIYFTHLPLLAPVGGGIGDPPGTAGVRWWSVERHPSKYNFFVLLRAIGEVAVS